jgi:hypothetical protein
MTITWDVAAPAAQETDPRAEAGIKALDNVRSIDWRSLTHDDVNALGRSVNLLADDPRYMWRIFRFYSRMLHAGKTYEALGLLREGNVRFRLRESWLDVNCTEISEPEVYRNISGEDGYDTYMAYSDALKDELNKVECYGFVVAGEAPEGSRDYALVSAMLSEYVPGANW